MGPFGFATMPCSCPVSTSLVIAAPNNGPLPLECLMFNNICKSGSMSAFIPLPILLDIPWSFSKSGFLSQILDKWVCLSMARYGYTPFLSWWGRYINKIRASIYIYIYIEVYRPIGMGWKGWLAGIVEGLDMDSIRVQTSSDKDYKIKKITKT